jgi:glycosyltransferase involved in cell wall biosynthesis
MNTAKPLHVVVFTPLGPGGKGGIDRLVDQLRIAFEAYPNVTCRFLTTRGPSYLALAPIYLAMTIVHIVAFKIVGRIDVGHINLSDKGSTYRKLIVAWVLWALRIPYVVHLHGAIYHKFWDSSPDWIDRSIRTLFRRSARIIALGSFWAELIRKRVPTATERIIILPPASPAICFDEGRRTHVGPVKIIFLGQLGARKGVPQLVAALGRLATEANWSAILAGNGEILETRAALEQLGVGNRVSVPGWVPEPEVFLREADILVLPSANEGLPLCVVEAFAHGIAVVCTPVGALPDIVEHERTGLLVEPQDVDGLTGALRRLLHDTDLRRRLGSNARTLHAERLELGAFVERLVAIWRDAASAK